MKGQVLVDFIAKWPNPVDCFDWKTVEKWILHVNGASYGVGTGIGLVLQFPIGECLRQVVWLSFHALNDEAKYEALHVEVSLALLV